MFIKHTNYISDSGVYPIQKDENGHFILQFKGVKFAGTKQEWILFARNISRAIETLENK